MSERQAQAILLIGSMLLAFMLLMNSCKTVQVVEKVREVQVHDTTMVADSVYVDRVHYLTQNGDTVFKTDSVYVYKYNTIYKTVESTKVDSIPYEVERIKEVKKVTGFTRFCIGFFIFAMIAFLGITAWRIYRRFFLHI